MDEYKIYFEKFKNAILLFIFGIVLFVFLLSKLMPSVQAIFRDNKTYKTQVESYEEKQRTLETLKQQAAKKSKEQKNDPVAKKFYKPIISGADTETIITDQLQDVITILRANMIKARSIDYEYDPADDAFVANAGDKYHVCRLTLELISDYKSFERFMQDLYKHEHFLDMENIEILPYEKNKKILLINMKLKLYAQK